MGQEPEGYDVKLLEVVSGDTFMYVCTVQVPEKVAVDPWAGSGSLADVPLGLMAKLALPRAKRCTHPFGLQSYLRFEGGTGVGGCQEGLIAPNLRRYDWRCRDSTQYTLPDGMDPEFGRPPDILVQSVVSGVPSTSMRISGSVPFRV